MKVLTLIIATLFPFMAHSLQILGATYEVPTSSDVLKNSNTFAITEAKLVISDENQMVFKYSVPQVLTGIKNEFVFTGTISTSGTAELSSDNGFMKCLVTNKEMMCSAIYQKLIIDKNKAVEMMTAAFEGDDLKNRLAVGDKFSTDPIGIIRLQLY